jgi:hypothetical protein
MVEVTRDCGPERVLPVGVGVESEPVTPDTNVSRITIKNPTINRITTMDLFFWKKLIQYLSSFRGKFNL